MNETQPIRKTSMSVPEMQKMLGLGKTEAYWLVKKKYFKTVVVGRRMRILLSSFEEWYANQFSYYKTNGPLPGAALRETTLSVAEIAQLLGIAEGTAEELLAKIKLEQVVVYGKRRILKDGFEAWYQSQSFYRTVSDQEADRQLYGDTITMPEIARMLGVCRNTVYWLVKAGHFETVKTARTTLVNRDSFEKWYQGQSRYRKRTELGKEGQHGIHSEA